MNSDNSRPIKVNINIGEQLTSISCGHVVVELMKFIAYQRMQIPFTYQWLKQIINRFLVSGNVENIGDMQAERQYRLASKAMESLDFLIKSLLQEINSALPEEICIMLGGSPMTCKEVYRLIMPAMCHKPQCHSNNIASDQKIQRSVFKSLVTSEKLSEVFFSPMTPTNMYVLIKKKSSNSPQILNPDSFEAFEGCRVPRSCKSVVIDLSNQQETLDCCNQFTVYGNPISQLENLQIDDVKMSDSDAYRDIESNDHSKWYQSTYVMVGFKDSMVNGTSVTNLWMDACQP